MDLENNRNTHKNVLLQTQYVVRTFFFSYILPPLLVLTPTVALGYLVCFSLKVMRAKPLTNLSTFINISYKNQMTEIGEKKLRMIFLLIYISFCLG